MNAGETTTAPRDPRQLKRIAGFQSSPLVGYEGSGAYFLDKIRDGVWRLEVYPDEVLVRDPFEQPRPDKIVSRLLWRAMADADRTCPDLGTRFHAEPINIPGRDQGAGTDADNGTFTAAPGVWLLSESGPVDRASLPKIVNRVGLDEFHVNKRVSYPDLILPLAPRNSRPALRSAYPRAWRTINSPTPSICGCARRVCARSASRLRCSACTETTTRRMRARLRRVSTNMR